MLIIIIIKMLIINIIIKMLIINIIKVIIIIITMVHNMCIYIYTYVYIYIYIYTYVYTFISILLFTHTLSPVASFFPISGSASPRCYMIFQSPRYYTGRYYNICLYDSAQIPQEGEALTGVLLQWLLLEP